MTREEKLVRRMEQGDTDAVEELIVLYYPEILKYCLWHTPNRTLAEDAVQETFLKAIRYTDRHVFHGKFKAFLYKIAANTCVDMQRRKWMSEEVLENMKTDPSYIEKGFDEVDEDVQLRQFVRSLKPELQEIVILRFGQELTMREIAEITGTPLRTVQTRLKRALKQIGQEWTQFERTRPESGTMRRQTELGQEWTQSEYTRPEQGRKEAEQKTGKRKQQEGGNG